MARVPDRLKRGPSWLREAINDIRDFAVASRPIRGRNTSIQEGADGTSINVTLSDGVTPAALEPRPFHLSKVTIDGLIWTRIRLGMVNNEIPTVVSAPDGMNVGDFPPCLIPLRSGHGYIWLKVTVDNSVDRAVQTVSIANGLSLPADTSNNFYLAIGTYNKPAKGVYDVSDNLSGSQWFSLCGGVQPEWRAL